MIAVLDYDAGNVMNVMKACDFIGEKTILTRNKDEISNAEKIILPGVGAFGDAMGKLNDFDLTETIRSEIKKGKPFLGICLGLQLLFEESDETPGVSGLGILPGKIKRFPKTEGFKIPHMGWNDLDIKKSEKLFKDVPKNPYVYFVHSYYLDTPKTEAVAAECDYITKFHAAVEWENVYACQFHPEKSGNVGLKILKNFCEV